MCNIVTSVFDVEKIKNVTTSLSFYCPVVLFFYLFDGGREISCKILSELKKKKKVMLGLEDPVA